MRRKVPSVPSSIRSAMPPKCETASHSPSWSSIAPLSLGVNHPDIEPQLRVLEQKPFGDAAHLLVYQKAAWATPISAAAISSSTIAASTFAAASGATAGWPWNSPRGRQHFFFFFSLHVDDVLLEGVDIQIQGSRILGGHSDIMFGCVSANAATVARLKDTVYTIGLSQPDDMYLAQRGLRTLGVRLARHYEAGLQIARWLEQRPEVLRVMHPALERDQDTPYGNRNSRAPAACSASCSNRRQKHRARLPQRAFALGTQIHRGGFESLAILFDCAEYAPRHDGHRAGRPCGSTSGWRYRKT